MKNVNARNIIMVIVGSIVLGLGIGMNAKVGIGTDAVSAVYTGVSNLSRLSLGTVTAMFNALFMIVAIILYKKNVGIATVVFMLVSKWPVDFGHKYMIHSDNMFVSCIMCVIAIAVIALGSEFLILSELGANSYDAMTMGIGKRLKHEVKYVYIRYACDGVSLIVALIIGGQVGIGTILAVLLIGNFMKMWQSILVKALKLETNSKLD